MTARRPLSAARASDDIPHWRGPRIATAGDSWSDLARLKGSEHDPAVWLRRASRNPAALPRLFVSCGRQDDLYPLSRAFPDACRSLGIPVEYHEEDGKHDWFFWDSAIRWFLAAVLGPVPR
jgi:S-formylglutathione hydrolase FrmB